MHAPVELHVDAPWRRRPAQRHVLVVRLQRGGAPIQKRGLRFGRHLVGPVVRELMVVEHRQPRRRCVRGLQIGVGLVLRIALPIAGQRHRLGPDVVADVAAGHRGLTGRVLVLVITEVHNEIRVLAGEPAVRVPPQR